MNACSWGGLLGGLILESEFGGGCRLWWVVVVSHGVIGVFMVRMKGF